VYLAVNIILVVDFFFHWQELEVEQYSQGEHCQENLEAQVSHLEKENSALHQYVHSLHTDLAASSLAATYLQKELAGR